MHGHDRDHGFNGELLYVISNGDYDSVFKIDTLTGDLYIDAALDREKTSDYLLNITVQDQGAPVIKSSSSLLHIIVEDVNDNAPQFIKSTFSFFFPENTPKGTPVVTLNATDPDLGLNGQVTYFLESSHAAQDFSLNPLTGLLTVASALDREAKEYYDLTIEAYDAGIPEMTGEVKVGITILDLNDNPPSFREIEEDGPNKGAIVFSFPENLPSGSKVGTIHVTDPDIGSNSEVRFRLLNTTLDEQFFFIDDSSSSGSTVLYTRKEFDYEVDRRQYQLQLRAESDPLRADVLVVVKLADVSYKRTSTY